MLPFRLGGEEAQLAGQGGGALGGNLDLAQALLHKPNFLDSSATAANISSDVRTLSIARATSFSACNNCSARLRSTSSSQVYHICQRLFVLNHWLSNHTNRTLVSVMEIAGFVKELVRA
jgi:hypothetical protein